MSITKQEVDEADTACRVARAALAAAETVKDRVSGLFWLQENHIQFGDIVTEARQGDRRMVVVGVHHGSWAICRWVLKNGALGADDHTCFYPVLVGHYNGELPEPVWR